MGKAYVIKTKEFLIEPVNPEDIWEGLWSITLRGDEPVKIGTASFAGEKIVGTVPIRVELDEEYRNKKYGTEVFKLMVDFAFGFTNIYEVSAQTELENDKCRYALEKAGFVHRSASHGIEYFSVTKPKSSWLALYLYIGLLVGLALGIILGSVWVGLVIGLVIGLVFGMSMDNVVKKQREKVTGQKGNERRLAAKASRKKVSHVEPLLSEEEDKTEEVTEE